MENVPNRKLTTVVLWHGAYRQDALDVLSILDRVRGVLYVYDTRIEGRSGDWRIVGEAFEPVERDMPPLGAV